MDRELVEIADATILLPKGEGERRVTRNAFKGGCMILFSFFGEWNATISYHQIPFMERAGMNLF